MRLFGADNGRRNEGSFHPMLFLVRILVVIGILAGLGYAALYAVGSMIEPEQRDIVVVIPTPKPKN